MFGGDSVVSRSRRHFFMRPRHLAKAPAALVIAIVTRCFLAALAPAASAAELRKLVSAEATQPGKREGERKRAFVSEASLKGVVVELHAATIKAIAYITAPGLPSPFGHARAYQSVGEVVADACAAIHPVAFIAVLQSRGELIAGKGSGLELIGQKLYASRQKPT